MKPELSELFVSPMGLLCVALENRTVLDVGFNSIELGPKHSAVGFSPNVFSIYENRELVFLLAQENYDLFEGEDYVEGLYSHEYVLSMIDRIKNIKIEGN